MGEATNFIVENIEKSYEVYKSICKMEDDVIMQLDKAIRSQFKGWLDESWEDYKLPMLENDNWIGVTRNELLFKVDEDDEDAYFWLSFGLAGDDQIWKFFGLPTENNEKVFIRLQLNLSILPDHKKLINNIDAQFKEQLSNLGFQRKGGMNDPYYNIDITFNNKAVLRGLINDDWEDALKPIKAGWQAIATLNWNQIIKLVKNA